VDPAGIGETPAPSDVAVAPPGPGAQADRIAVRAQVAVVSVFLVHGFLFATWAPYIPKVKAHLGIGNGTLGLALLGTPIGSIAAIAIAARFVPRLGSRRVVQLALAGYCLVGVLVGLVGSVVALLLVLFAWGFFQGTLDVSMNTQAIAVEGRRERALMNGIHAWWSVGAFAGAALGTLGVALGLPLWALVLVAGAVSLVGSGSLTGRMLDDGRARPTTAPPAGERTRRVPVSKGMLVLGAIAFASMLCEGAAADWSSVYVRDSLDGGAAAGLGYTAFAFAMFAVRAGGDRLLSRVPVHRLLSALALAAAAVFAVALTIGTVPAALVGFFVLGLGLGAVVPSAFSAAGRLPGMHPGVGVAGVSGLGWAGFVCGPPLIGGLAGATSLPTALGIVPVLTLLIAFGCLRAPALRVRPGPSER
jgi:MFS family permease